MEALQREGFLLTDACVDEFALELEGLIFDAETRKEFIRRWKAAIAADVAESRETTSSLLPPPAARISPISSKMSILDELRRTPAKTERPLQGLQSLRSETLPSLPAPLHTSPAALQNAPAPLHAPQPAPLHNAPAPLHAPRPASEWVLSDEDAQALALKYPVRIFGRRAPQDAKRKRGIQGHGSVGFNNKSGSYFLILAEGFLQLSNGMIEGFFHRAELTMTDFFTD